MPRIVTGKAKGIKLEVPPGTVCRPTSDRAKQALFSIIGTKIEGARVLDVFAGSGQIALEALSRGAAEAVMIERDRAALVAIKKNISKTRLDTGVRVLAGDYRHQLEYLIRIGERFDFIYLDPPWQISEKVIYELENILPELVCESGVLIVESEGRERSETWFAPMLIQMRSCQYGTSVISFYQHNLGSEESQ